MTFTPERIEMAAGERVNLALTATDTFHDLNIDTTDFHLGVQPGATDRGGLVLTDPGTYVAYCSVPGHREAGMEIAIVVRPEPVDGVAHRRNGPHAQASPFSSP